MIAGSLGIAATAAALLPEAAAAGAKADERGRHRRRRHGRRRRAGALAARRARTRAEERPAGRAGRVPRGTAGQQLERRSLGSRASPSSASLNEDARVSRFRSRPQETNSWSPSTTRPTGNWIMSSIVWTGRHVKVDGRLTPKAAEPELFRACDHAKRTLRFKHVGEDRVVPPISRNMTETDAVRCIERHRGRAATDFRFRPRGT